MSLITTIGTSSSVHSSVLMESEAPIKPITEVSAIADVFPEVINQSECVVSGSIRYCHVCHVELSVNL